MYQIVHVGSMGNACLDFDTLLEGLNIVHFVSMGNSCWDFNTSLEGLNVPSWKYFKCMLGFQTQAQQTYIVKLVLYIYLFCCQLFI